MSKLKTNCYQCKHRRELTFSCHSKCLNPDPNMTGDEHGKKNGWFFYPVNFDPVWRTKECINFERK